MWWKWRRTEGGDELMFKSSAAAHEHGPVAPSVFTLTVGLLAAPPHVGPSGPYGSHEPDGPPPSLSAGDLKSLLIRADVSFSLILFLFVCFS